MSSPGLPAHEPETHSPVNVVVVHGIGRQERGSTAGRLVDALHRHWTDDVGAGSATVHGAELVEGGIPEISLSLAVADETVQVVVTEAYWADAFYPPSVRDVLRWVGWVAPLAAVTRGIEAVSDSFARWWPHPWHWWRIVAAVVLTVLGLPVAMVLVMTAGLAALIRPLLPFAWLRDLAATIGLALSQVVGDSYLYLMSPASSGAIRTRVSKALAAAAERGGPVVVLAHSQGAQVTVDALTAEPVEVRHLVTFGSGIGQLAWIRRIRRTRPALFLTGLGAWAVILAAGAGLGTLVYGLQEGRFERVGVLMGLTAGWYLVPFATVMLVRFLSRQGRLRVLAAGKPIAIDGVSAWTDLSATADPVSGTPIVSRMYAGVSEHVVVNGGSLLTDHVRYLANGPEVIARMAAEICHAGGHDALADRVRPTDSSIEVRHRVFRWVVGGRIAGLAAAALLAGGLWPGRTEAGRAVLETMQPVLGFFGLTDASGRSVAGVPLTTVAMTGGAAAYGVGLALAVSLICRLWRRERTGSEAAWTTVDLSFAVTVCAVEAAVLGLLLKGGAPSTWSDLTDRAPELPLALLFVGFALGVLAGLGQWLARGIGSTVVGRWREPAYAVDRTRPTPAPALPAVGLLCLQAATLAAWGTLSFSLQLVAVLLAMVLPGAIWAAGEELGLASRAGKILLALTAATSLLMLMRGCGAL